MSINRGKIIIKESYGFVQQKSCMSLIKDIIQNQKKKNKMQEKNIGNIQSWKDFKPITEQDLVKVLEFIKNVRQKHKEMNEKQRSENKKVMMDEKVLKKLEGLTKESSKIVSKFPEILMSIVRELVEFFYDIPHPQIITLITNIMGPDMKFQALSIEPSLQSQQIPQISDLPVIALPMEEQSIIALPNSKDCTTLAIHQPSDVGLQQNRHANQLYYLEDDQRVAEYLHKPFKTVNRQGINHLFEKTTHFLLDQLIEKLIQSNAIINLHADSVTAVLKIIQYISVSLYTYYFLSLVTQLTRILLESFSPFPQTNFPKTILQLDLQQKIKRTEYEELIYAVRSMSERWNDHKGDFNIELWEWQMEQHMIVNFLQSTTSQKQLHSVKTLIDRCRKVQYNSYSVLSLEELIHFIQNHHLIQQIYKAQNHPEVTIKGKEVFEFMAKNNGLDHHLIDVVFELIPKSNQNICKALYSTLQATGHENLQKNREYLMTKISCLPRSSLFYNETFTLIEALILLAPIEIISQSLKYVYHIIFSHYFGLKPHLKDKLLNIYFEVYLMGVEQDEFDTNQNKMMIVLEPFLSTRKHIYSRLTFLIVDKFLEKLKQHIPKKIGAKCKKIMSFCIQMLFTKYKIHQILQNQSQNEENLEGKQLRQSQLQLIKQLLQASDKQLTRGFLSQKQLWELIEKDSYFGRFLSFYSTESQLYLLQKLICKSSITEKDIKNIIESYYFMDKDVKEKIFGKIYYMFYSSKDIFIKQKLVEFVTKVANQPAESLVKKIMREITELENNIQKKETNLQHILAVLMQLKQSLALHDKQGCGSYPAFKYLTNDYSVKLKVLNMIDLFNPTNFQLEQKNYKTLYDVVRGLLPILGKSLKEIKLKIDKNQKYVTLQELKEKLNELSPYRQISLTIEESSQCEWYNQSLLISKSSKQMNPQIIQILKQIFNQYSQQINNQKRLFKQGACRIFERATSAEHISTNDMRILHLFNNYSDTGEYLTVHEWLNFYYQSALTNPYLVISNLKNLGYGHIFQTASEMIENFTLQTQNTFRQYFALNQHIYHNFFQLFQILRARKTTQLTEKICHLTLNLLKDLPQYNQLQNDVYLKFFEGKTENNKKFEEVEMIEENNQESSNKQSIEKVYFITMILSHRLDKWEEQALNYQNDKMEQIKQMEQMKQQESESQSNRRHSLYKLQKIKDLNSKKIEQLFSQLLDNQKHPKIDPLNLSYEQNMIILVLQNIGRLLTQPLFKQINSIKNKLKMQVSELVPLSNLQIENKISLQGLNLQSLNLIGEKLFQLSAINADLLSNYSSILLCQPLETEQAKQRQKTQQMKQRQKSAERFKQIKIIQRVLQYFVFQENVLFSKQQSLSKLSNHLVYLLSDSVQGLVQWYSLGVLNQSKHYLFNEEKGSTVEYFKTLDQLLLIETDPQILNQTTHLIYSILEEQTSKHSYADFYESKHHSQTIEGLLVCLKTLYSTTLLNLTPNSKPSTLIESLLTNFLLSEKSQSSLYSILSTLNKQKPENNLAFAYKRFTELQLKKNSKLNTENQSECGIYNLGCICYINSVFQQLFHLNTFTEAIIQLPVNQKQTEPYFVQLQKVFYGLKYSKRAFLITNKFCENYTDYTGQPINIKQQHDADEFLNNLLDKIQKTCLNLYKIPREQTVTHQLFQGSMSNVITCQNCFTHKANNEEFYVISLEIKNQTSLTECLDKMVEPQVICDYYCNTCDKKVDSIHKFRKFNTLPNILFIHFQRLVFDLETFTKVKLDHPVNFTQEIDLQKYFYNDQTQPCKYRLLGFIVHFGNSEGGHYISLIKDESNSWKKYDDSRITKWFWKTGIHQKDNAYLLIYQKIHHNEGEESKMHDEKLISNTTTLNYCKVNKINQKILHEITEDNILLGKEITVIRPDFGKFLISELQRSKFSSEEIGSKFSSVEIVSKQENEDIENDLLKTKLIWKYFRIIDEAKSVGFSEALPLKDSELEYLAMKFLQNNRSPETAQHFLDLAVEQGIVKTLYQSGQKKLRQVFSVLLINIVSMWDRYFPQMSYMIPVKENETIRKLMNQIENALTEVGKNFSKMDEYFEFLLVVSRMVPKVREYFRDMNLLAKLVHFVMNKDSNLVDKFGLYPTNAPTNKKLACFNSIIETVSMYLQEFPELVKNELVNLCLGEKGFEFYKKVYEERYQNCMKLNQILSRLCCKNLELSRRVIDELILNRINRFSKEDFYIIAYLDLIYSVLRIDDNLKEFRMLRVMGIPTLLIEGNLDQEIMMRKKKQRIVGYWSNYLSIGDQMIIPFLQQLYNSRQQLTYFSLTGIVYLLQLMKENHSVLNYVTSLPSPCLFYSNYLSWIAEFIKNSLKNIHNKHFDKIDIKITLNRISLLLQQIQTKQLDTHIYEHHSQKKLQNHQSQTLQNHESQKMQLQIHETIPLQDNNHFMDLGDWLKRNERFLFGQIVQKSQTRLINQPIYQFSLQKSSISEQQPLLSIPITYCILKTMQIKDRIAFGKEILSLDDVIQPNQSYCDQLSKKLKINQMLQSYLSPEKLDNSLLQISFSGQNYQLLPYKYKNYVLNVKFLYHAYPYELLISVDKLINQECKLIVPSPIRDLPDDILTDNAFIDSQIQKCIKITLLSLKNPKPQNQDKMEESHPTKNQSNRKNKSENSIPSQKNLNSMQEEYPSMDQVYGSDAYMQQAEPPSKTQDVSKQELCIECPFCSYFAHEFASRCPGCNEEWGYFA